MTRARYRRLFWMCAPMLGAACTDLPGEEIEGVVRSEQPVLGPVSGDPVCAVRLCIHHPGGSAGGTSRGGSSTCSPTRYAAPLTLEVGTESLAVEGAGGAPALVEHAAWLAVDGRPIPEGVAGYHAEIDDYLANCRGRDCRGDRTQIEEQVVTCGAKLRVRGTRTGTRLVLAAGAEEAVRARAEQWMWVCSGVGVLLMVTGIGWAVARRLRKRGAPA